MDKLSTLRQLYTGTRTAGNILQCLEKDRLCSWKRPAEFRQRYLDQKLATTDHMYSVNISGHCGCVNALAFSNVSQQYLVTAGDDERVLLWRVGDVMQGLGGLPTAMETRHQSNVFSVVCSWDDAFVFSAGNDAQVIKHDFKTGQMISSYSHLDAVYCVAAHPTDSAIIATASEDGCVYIIDTRKPTRHLTQDMVLIDSAHSYHSVDFNPVAPHLLAVSSAGHGTLLYDTRIEDLVLRYRSSQWTRRKEDSVSACFNSTGSQLFVLRKRQPPCLFSLWEEEPLFSFFDDSGGYRNSVTMKSGCFMGQNDEYVVSGSDDFRIYVWKIPDLQHKAEGSVSEVDPQVVCDSHLILPGHMSIVNQVRYSKVYRLLASSGVEKKFKLWSHLPLPPLGMLHQSGSPPARRRFSPHEIWRQQTAAQDYDSSSSQTGTTLEDPSVWSMFDLFIEQDTVMPTSSSSASPTSVSSLGYDSSTSSEEQGEEILAFLPPLDFFANSSSTSSSSSFRSSSSSASTSSAGGFTWSAIAEGYEREVVELSDTSEEEEGCAETRSSGSRSDNEQDDANSSFDSVGKEECRKVTRLESKQRNGASGSSTEPQASAVCTALAVSSEGTLNRKRKFPRACNHGNPATYRKEDFLKSKPPTKSASPPGPGAVANVGESSGQIGEPDDTAAGKTNNT